jgi:hypothetical protein
MGSLHQFNQRRRPFRLRPEFELVDAVSNYSFVKSSRSGRIEMEGGFDAFAAKVIE